MRSECVGMSSKKAVAAARNQTVRAALSPVDQSLVERLEREVETRTSDQGGANVRYFQNIPRPAIQDKHNDKG